MVVKVFNSLQQTFPLQEKKTSSDVSATTVAGSFEIKQSKSKQSMLTFRKIHRKVLQGVFHEDVT